MSVEDFVIECGVLPTRPGISAAERLDVIRMLVDRFCEFPGNESGGSLHIVLDDGNIEREHVEFCRDWARDHDDPAGEAFAELLLTLTDEERDLVCFDADEAP